MGIQPIKVMDANGALGEIVAGGITPAGHPAVVVLWDGQGIEGATMHPQSGDVTVDWADPIFSAN